MVSIPDWSKFSRLHDTLKEPGNLNINKYYKQREEESIRQAEERGYFRVPTEEFLIERNAYRNGRNIYDANHLRLIKLVGVHMRKLGEITFCTNLRICILNNNFLTKIDGLAACRHLIRLDLHSNQLSSVPSISFWSGLRKLKFLNLHDNPLGKYDTLQSLATCPHLMALTLYDTPLSLKRNYRHHVVNSIWSLKALDQHVISDEEIIEDAVFGGRFGTLHPAFRIELCPPAPEETTYSEEMYIIQSIEARINEIMAHHSPVLIIQRYIRSFITRKRFGFLGRKVSQKQMTSDAVPPPPSSSPAFGTTLSGQDISLSGSVTMDYDMYMKTRRSESSAKSDRTTISGVKVPQVETSHEPAPTPIDGDSPVPQETLDAPKKRKNLLINLAKLQNGTFSSLYDEAIAIETILPDPNAEKFISQSIDGKKKGKKKKKEAQRRVVKSVKQFFGPIVDSSPALEEPVKTDFDEDLPVTEYRLRGVKPNIMLVDATTEMILSKQEAGRYVRDAEEEAHIRARDLPKPKITPRKNINTDQRLFARVHGTMGISSLLAVHQAYKDREKAEKTVAKMEHILNLRDERDRAKERIRIFNDEKRNQALRKRDQERARMLEALEQREMKRLNYLDKKHDIKARSSDLSRSFRADFTFITEFSNQHTSVSNALMRHDRQAKLEDQLNNKSELIQGQKATSTDQQEVVKKYMEHRQLMRQTESAMARNALDTRMLQEANDRLMEAKSRVAQQKARRNIVKTFYPLPQAVAGESNEPVSNVTVDENASRFETSMLMTHGRVGKHHTAVV